MNQKGIAPLIIVAIVVVVVVVAGVGIYVATRGGGENAGGGGGGGGGGITGATSLQFDITDTSSGLVGTIKAKNIGSSNLKLRLDETAPSAMSVLINEATQTVWIYASGTWMDMSSYFENEWSAFNTEFAGYLTDLSSWTGSGSITVGTVTFSNIQVNPTLDDSLFEH
jgi:hypothetical protein